MARILVIYLLFPSGLMTLLQRINVDATSRRFIDIDATLCIKRHLPAGLERVNIN